MRTPGPACLRMRIFRPAAWLVSVLVLGVLTCSRDRSDPEKEPIGEADTMADMPGMQQM